MNGYQFHGQDPGRGGEWSGSPDAGSSTVLTDLERFLKSYAPGEHAARIIEIDVPELSKDGPDTPFIVLRWGRFAVVVNPQGLSDHLSIDVHPFVDGKDARVGVFGMDQDVNGQVGFGRDQVAGTSHGWPATAMAVLLVGEQAGAPVPPSNSSRREDDLAKWDVNNALSGDRPTPGTLVYIDLGDSVDKGGEVVGVLQELSAAGVRVIDGEVRQIPWSRIVFMERR